MSSERAPLKGGCQCGRNVYQVQLPRDLKQVAQVFFPSHPSLRYSQASPLAAFLRVPLSWYRSNTFAFFPDETSSMIRKVYSPPTEHHNQRHFCGFCGTSLSYWSEQPRSEADFIQLTLESLSPADLANLDDLGVLPDSDEEDGALRTPDAQTGQDMGVWQSRGSLPWLEGLVAGSRLGRMRSTQGGGQSADGSVRYEWEVVEWVGDDEGEGPKNGKRKLDDQDEPAQNVQE